MLDKYTTPEDQKKAIIGLLIQMKHVDGTSKGSEINYIINVANHLGLDEEDVHEVRQNINKYTLTPPKDEGSRMTILYYLLFLMNIDGTISSQEEKLVQEFSFRLGFRTSLTSDLISLIKQYADKQVPPEEMLAKIKTYLN